MWGPEQQVYIHNPRTKKTGRSVMHRSAPNIRKYKAEREKYKKGSSKWRQADLNLYYSKANFDSGLEAAGGKRAKRVKAKRFRRYAAKASGSKTKAGRKKAATSVRRAASAWF